MAASVPAATAIILVAALISFGVYHSAEDSAQDAVLRAQEAMFSRQQDMLASELTISLAHSVYDEHDVFLHSRIAVENTGVSVLRLGDIHLLLNGLPADFDCEILSAGGSQLWMPGEVAVLTIEDELRIEESNRIKVVSGNGASDLIVYGGA